MSDCSRGSALLCDVKPRHVRSLNFGQSILELDAVEQCRVPNRVLVFDEKVAHIPYTEKEDYVRKWLEAHENDKRDSSPVLGPSATTASQESPILGSGRKRSRRKVCINRNATAKRLNNVANQGSAGHSASCTTRSKSQRKCKKRIQHTPSSTEKVAVNEVSPILGTRIFKRKRRKLQYKSEASVSPEHLKLYDHKITKTDVQSIRQPAGNLNNLRKTPVDQDKLERNLDKGFVSLAETRASPEKYQRCIETSSTLSEKLSFADSSSNKTDKNDSQIEAGTSNDSTDEECNKLTNISGSSDNLSYFIEDDDTQETAKRSKFSAVDRHSIPSGQPFTPLQFSNETYCSEAELMQDQSTRLSERISEMPSLNKTTQKTCKSTQTAIISTITTPSKKSPDKNTYARLLDSGKKRHKPKKGSMAARLQSLVNAQVSGIRIWRHQMSKEHDATSVRYISVLVCDSIKQFGNQFLEGVLIEDRYNLLQNDIEIEQAESHNAEAQPKTVLYKNITIMLVCDIVGTLKMISKVVINVYPPWNILDKDDLILEATYISISDREVPDISNVRKSCERKKRILKEFNCPCIEEQRELLFCSRKPSSDKPDVMQQIFNF